MAKLTLKNIKKKENITIEEVYKEYLDYCIAIGQRQKTIESKIRFFRYEFPKLIDITKDIKEINKRDIENHVITMRKEGYKGNTYQTFIIKLKAFLSYSFRNNYLDKFEVKIPTISLEKKEVYKEEDLEKLLKKPNINNCLVGDFRSWATINFLLGTGCRSETLLNIKVCDINFENDSILFRHMKTKKQVIVPLSKTLKVVLNEYIKLMRLKQEDILFPKLNGEKMSYDTLHQNLCIYFKHRKVKMKGVNTFRNTFATMFIKNKGDIYRLKVILAHSNIKTTERYINLLPLELESSILEYNPLDVLSKKNSRLSIKRGNNK